MQTNQNQLLRFQMVNFWIKYMAALKHRVKQPVNDQFK